MLNVTPQKLNGFEEAMAREGPGVFAIEGGITDEGVVKIQEQMPNPEQTSWHDATGDFNNGRLTVSQNFDVYGLKLCVGDPEPIRRLPAVNAFVHGVRNLVNRDLAVYFPALENWLPDEVALQRYRQAGGKLTFHHDNARHSGLIVTGSVEGEADLLVKHHEQVLRIAVTTGTLVLLRATHLLSDKSDKELRPEHAVTNIRTPFRTSVTVRANNRPLDEIPGFFYQNWEPPTHKE